MRLPNILVTKKKCSLNRRSWSCRSIRNMRNLHGMSHSLAIFSSRRWYNTTALTIAEFLSTCFERRFEDLLRPGMCCDSMNQPSRACTIYTINDPCSDQRWLTITTSIIDQKISPQLTPRHTAESDRLIFLRLLLLFFRSSLNWKEESSSSAERREKMSSTVGD